MPGVLVFVVGTGRMEIEGDRGRCKRVGRAVLDRVYNKSRGRKAEKGTVWRIGRNKPAEIR